MKKTIFLFFILFASVVFGQQIDLRGRVLIQNSKYNTDSIKYVEKAFIEVSGAQAVFSDEEGKFKLVVVDREIGSSLLLNVQKAKYKVINQRELSLITLGGLDNVNVYLAEEKYINKERAKFYGINLDAFLVKKDRIINSLNNELVQNEKVVDDFNKENGLHFETAEQVIKFLENKQKDFEKELPIFIDQLAEKNLDFESALYIKTYEVIEMGRLDEVKDMLSLDTLISWKDDLNDRFNTYFKDTLFRHKNPKSKIIDSFDLNSRRDVLDLELNQLISTFELLAGVENLYGNLFNVLGAYKLIIALIDKNRPDDLRKASYLQLIGHVYTDLWLELKKNVLLPDKVTTVTKYRALANRNQTEAFKIFTETPELSIDLLAKAYYEMGYTSINFYYTSDKYLAYFEKCIALIKKSKLYNGLIIESFLKIIEVYEMKVIENEDKASKEYIKKTVKLFNEAIYIQSNIDSTSELMGDVYQKMGLFEYFSHEERLKALIKSNQIYKETLKPSHPKLAESFRYLGDFYSLITYEGGDIEKALGYYEKSAAVYELIMSNAELDFYLYSQFEVNMEIIDLCKFLKNEEKVSFYSKKTDRIKRLNRFSFEDIMPHYEKCYDCSYLDYQEEIELLRIELKQLGPAYAFQYGYQRENELLTDLSQMYGMLGFYAREKYFLDQKSRR